MNTEKCHVAVLAFPYGTHAGPLHALAAALAVAARHVTFSFLSSAASLSSLSLSSPPNLSLHDVTLPPTEPNRPPDLTAFLTAAPAAYRHALARAVHLAGTPVSYLISDAFLWFAPDLVDGPVPWAALWTAGPVSLSAHLAADRLAHVQQDSELGLVPGLELARVKDLPNGVLTSDRDSPIAQILYRMAVSLPRVTALLVNAFEGIDVASVDFIRAQLKMFLLIGPFNLLIPGPVNEDLSGCLSWLDSCRDCHVVYIAFGSMAGLPDAELAELANGLEESGVHFLWALKKRFWAGLPDGFMDRVSAKGLVVEWAPQRDVLAHRAVGVFVSHCGWNSVLESVAGGVPMICRPMFGDQMINARAVSHGWKIGVGLPEGGITREGIAAALDTVLRTEEGRKMKERAVEIRELAVSQVRPGGKSAQNFETLVKMVSDAGTR